MSLKHFHLLFIACATLFSLLFGAWALLMHDLSGSIRVMGALSVIIGLALAVYGVWFRKKARRIIT